MPLLRRLHVGLLALMRRRRIDLELDEEMRYHVDADIERLVAAGMSADEARRTAMRRFGNVTSHTEAARAAWRWEWIEQVGQDLRYAARILSRSRMFTTIAVLSLAIAIGACASVFGIVDAFYLRRLPVREPNRLVFLREGSPPARVRDDFSSEGFARLRETSVFAGVAAINVLDRANVRISGAGGSLDPTRVRVALVSGGYFRLMGVAPERGRALGEADDRVEGAHPLAVISHSYWVRRLNRAPDAVGRSLTMNGGGTAFTIVGVMPAGFTGDWLGRPVDIWVPTMMQSQVMIEEPGLITHENAYWLRVLARLAPGIDAARAESEAQLVYDRILRRGISSPLTAEDQRWLAQRRLHVKSAERGYSPQRETLDRPVAILVMMGVLVLIVTCANVASLLLARTDARQREMGIRLAVGAGRWRLVRQVMTECLLLSALAGVVATIFALWGTGALAVSIARAPVQMFWAASSWVSFDARLSARGLAVIVAMTTAAGVFLGVIAAARAARQGSTRAIAARAAVPGRRGNATGFALGKALVVAQVAVSLSVLVSAALLARSMQNLSGQDLGFRHDRVLLVWTQPSSTGRDAAG